MVQVFSIVQVVSLILTLLIAGDELQPEAKFTGFIVVCIMGIICIGTYIVKAIAVCKMAKKRGLKKWWLGMFPYFNYSTVGELAGPVRLFRKNFKNIGNITALFYFLIDVLSVVALVLNMAFGNGGEVSNGIYVLSVVLNILSMLIDIVAILSFFSLSYALFGKYTPEKRFLFTFLSCFIPVSFPFILIAIMNRKPYDSFEDYYKEQFAKRFGQSYNPYVNPYRTNENPFSDNQPVNNGNAENVNSDNNSDGQSDKNINPFDEY